MPTAASVIADLKKKGRETTRKTFVRHGMPADRVLGVNVADIKTIAKQIKGEHALACELYETGIIEAMYLAGLVADGSKMTRKQLQAWVDGAAHSQLISDYAVPWVAVESSYGRNLAMQWIESKQEHVAACGWCTYAHLVATEADGSLDLAEVEELLNVVVKRIGAAQSRVRYNMNGFVISVGSHVSPLVKQAKAAARKIGAVSVNMGDTACKVPIAIEYIEKNEANGRLGNKRKTIR